MRRFLAGFIVGVICFYCALYAAAAWWLCKRRIR